MYCTTGGFHLCSLELLLSLLPNGIISYAFLKINIPAKRIYKYFFDSLTDTSSESQPCPDAPMEDQHLYGPK